MKYHHKIFIPAIVIAAVVMIMTSCTYTEEPSPTPPIEAPRTVLVYMVAENNLSTSATKDIGEMATAALSGHLGDSRLLVYHDTYNNNPVLFEILPDGAHDTIRTYNNATMAVDTRRLKEVIDDTRASASAQRYGIIFWGHGSGYVQDGIEVKPQSYGGETINNISYWMNNTDMAAALEGQGFDWIYFDCCFMASIESVYELRHAADYIVGSATELPGDGMPYQSTLQYLMPLDSDLKAAARSTFDYYDNRVGTNRTCTMSVIRTSALDALADVMREVFTTTCGLPADYKAQPFQTEWAQQKYGWEYYDMLHYAQALAGDNAELEERLKTSFNEAVELTLATPMLWNSISLANHHGLATLIVEKGDNPLLDKFNYRELSWWRDVVSHRFN